MANIVELIFTEERTGHGRELDDPVRMVQQYWTKDGHLVFSIDEFKGEVLTGTGRFISVLKD